MKFFFFFGGGGGISKFDYFYGLFTKINYCYLCYVMKFTILHTTTTIKHAGQGTKQKHFLGFSKISSIILGVLEISDIFFFWGGGLT